MKKTFIISNITKNDVESNLLRIKKDYKRFLPGADNIEPKSYEIKIKVGS
ncbi:hypothetical protein SAMN05660462_02334 [Proteiniborus ethanoligenes]|uniref:Uncharacterized protein n=1 Tax=Proteiniborus ethanoligenes TaxID=415015 RepID=A0A1H3RDT1_9FIRM|nr:hypothetical protein [Proteiniborus ethanoligenes]SDZ23992.1 hypothetical protein SAMN05660462_02334 [Proteiniborus ethanoligenes]